MITQLHRFGLMIACVLGSFATLHAQTTATAPAAGNNVSFQTFYDQLANQGTWINTDKYGYAFQPRETDPNWRPYTYGHWVNTDAGLTWASDEPFGWATYHYGRWVNLVGQGWVWVPGTTWGPAWVSWREGGDDVGWAPLPPDSDIGIDFADGGLDIDFGFHIGNDCDTAYGIGPWCYNFCPVIYIGDSFCWRHFRDRRDNFAFIGRTRNVTDLNYRRNGEGRFGSVRAEGPNVAALNARSHEPIRNARLAEAGDARGVGLHGGTYSVYAPRVDTATFRTARPATVARNVTGVQVNHGTDVNRPFAMNERENAPAATAAQVGAANADRGQFAGARVATDQTHFAREFAGSMAALHLAHQATVGHTSIGAVRGEEANRFASHQPVTAARREVTSRDAGFTGEGRNTREANASVANRSFAEHAQQFHAVTHSEASHPAPAYHPAYHAAVPSYHAEAHSFHSAPAAHAGGGGHAGGGAHASAGGSHSGGGRR
jgi:hypothetical protein